MHRIVYNRLFSESGIRKKMMGGGAFNVKCSNSASLFVCLHVVLLKLNNKESMKLLKKNKNKTKAAQFTQDKAQS